MSQNQLFDYSKSLQEPWELYDATVPEYFDGKVIVTFAKRNGRTLNGAEDITNVPKEFYDAHIGGFNFNAYSVNMQSMQDVCFDFAMDFPEWEKRGTSVFLWSETPGSGKTFLACSMAKSAMIKFDLRMRFITAISYAALAIAGKSKEAGAEDPSKVYRECDLLVLDDIDAKIVGTLQQQELRKLVIDRFLNGLITIFTSNSSPENLNFDKKTIEKIKSKSMVFAMPEESIELKKAEKKHQEFLKEVLARRRRG